ncbi:MAG: GSCFA domain-containing protein [Bacteroidota bacterium]|nr:GSCFA domain-containing protein [Bacteroidota bacterium]
MDFMLNIDLKKLPRFINYLDRILLTGSCFTEHIGNALADSKFSVLQNPNGILFDPVSVGKSLLSYIDNKQYDESELFYLNEVWNSWQHHSRFSNMNLKDAVQNINRSQQRAHTFLKSADWLIITLGSSFSYRLTREAGSAKAPPPEGFGEVANCHRAPAQWFHKHLLEINETISILEDCYRQLMKFNPGIYIILTVSPVRHTRDGVVENNRSKARLIEAVHNLAGRFDNIFYFPAYELVIDVLRDYRFYDIDLAHPNYMATEFVLEKFSASCIDESSQQLMQEIRKISIARKHKAFQPGTQAHRQFLMNHFEKTKMLKEKYPFLNLDEELAYFSQT